jgi:hypothetical protein
MKKMEIEDAEGTALSRLYLPAKPSTAKFSSGLSGTCLLTAMLVAGLYVAGIAKAALFTGAFFVLFPELGALAYGTLARPHGRWSNAPILLVLTPGLAAIAGTLVARHCPYGYFAVLLAVGGALVVIRLLSSPIGPAASAALFPVVFAEKSWWYSPAVFMGTTVLALICAMWKRSPMVRRQQALRTPAAGLERLPELPPVSYYYAYLGLGIFLLLAVWCVKLTGLRFLLFPPLAVLGFEAFSRPRSCAWAARPLMMPLACFLTAGGGLLFCKFGGLQPWTAAASMAWSFLVLYVLDLHIPPAMAVGLIPLIMTRPTIAFPVAVVFGTLLLTICYLVYRWLLQIQPCWPAGRRTHIC